MKYIVTGQNLQTGARQTLEFEADSKAAAEKKAAATGMDVRRVDEAGVDRPMSSGAVQQRRQGGGCGRALFLLFILIVVIAGWSAWKHGMLPSLHK